MATDDSLLRTLLLVGLAIVVLPMIVMAVAMPVLGLWGWGHTTGAGPPIFWIGAAVLPLLVILGIGSLLVAAVRGPSGTDPALEELRVAYARGDLSDEEFERRRERLRRDE